MFLLLCCDIFSEKSNQAVVAITDGLKLNFIDCLVCPFLIII